MVAAFPALPDIKPVPKTLILAAEAGDLERVRGFDINGDHFREQRDDALRGAAKKGHLEVVRYLVEQGADIHAYNDGALRQATWNGHLEIVRYLGEQGANIHAYNDYALRWAAWNGHLEIVRYLKEQGANIHAYSDEALRYAAANGHLEVARYLVEQGADIRANHNEALRVAASYGRLEVARYLVEQGAKTAFLSEHQQSRLNQYEIDRKAWMALHCLPPAGLEQSSPLGWNAQAHRAAAAALQREGYQGADANRYAYNAAMLFGSEDRLWRYLQRWGEAGKQPLHDAIQMIAVPQGEEAARWDRKAWGDAVLAQGPKMAKLVKFAGKLTDSGEPFLPLRAGDGKISLALTIQEAAKFAYPNAAEHPELAALCMQHGMAQEDFDFALKLLRKTPRDLVKNIPDITIPGEEFGMPGCVWRRLAPQDLKGLFLGEYTGCCQHIGGEGKDCAAHGHSSAQGGFYVLEQGKRIIGQSWAWRGKGGELVLDSLESRSGCVTAANWQKLMQLFAAKLAENPGPRDPVTALHIGTGGATPSALGFASADAATPRDYSGYRDSKTQYRVAEFAPKPERKRRRTKDAACESSALAV